jgi:hypothetical protein
MRVAVLVSRSLSVHRPYLQTFNAARILSLAPWEAFPSPLTVPSACFIS